MRAETCIHVTPCIHLSDDADGNPWAVVYGLHIPSDIMDRLVAAWLLKTIVPPYTARRGYEDPEDWTLS